MRVMRCGRRPTIIRRSLCGGDPETAQAAAFPVMAPLVFASSAFVPVSTMPSWLQPFAEHQPVSVTASAVRALMIGGPTTSYAGGGFDQPSGPLPPPGSTGVVAQDVNEA
jgi:hypothetical protein